MLMVEKKILHNNKGHYYKYKNLYLLVIKYHKMKISEFYFISIF